MILARVGTDYDAVYFVLGSIAPDCFDREDSESFRAYHFVRDSAKPDLDIFLKATHLAWQGRDVRTLSFVAGYLSHLWLDIFFRVHADDIKVSNPSNLPPDELRTFLRANVEEYDFTDSATFLGAIQELPLLFEPITGLEFVSLDCAVHLLRQLRDSIRSARNRCLLPVVISREDYIHFLESAVDEFVTELGEFG
jgi:hypothetical protein